MRRLWYWLLGLLRRLHEFYVPGDTALDIPVDTPIPLRAGIDREVDRAIHRAIHAQHSILLGEGLHRVAGSGVVSLLHAVTICAVHVLESGVISGEELLFGACRQDDIARGV